MAAPLKIEPSAATGWSDSNSLIVSAANWWAETMPRGRGAVPRFLSKLVPKGRKETFKTKHGAKLAMVPRVLDIYAAMKRKGRTWDAYVFETCRSLLKPGDVFYDLGGSVGYMTIEMATLFAGKVRCFTFEPQPDLARSIAISAALNGVGDAVTIFETMVGETEREETLMLTSHSLHASVNAAEEGGQELKRQMVSLDQLVGSGEIPPPDVIKIDIEGGELQAFRGAQEVIRQHSPHIVFEVNSCADRFGYGRKDLFELLQGLAEYEFFEIEHDGSLRPARSDEGTPDILARSVARTRASA
ncbi:FkbM family methyltransferase [Lacipirellula parvula]|uniref:Methyltransferase FkbM domain-containing protein n=1 Tax=Lacipirellula parvula TaxID=2650471 RepID=A0A5K7XAC8_9BACT|nr:FkbM family methyltransferase [Lacipirellula parvula]BBO31373.1 hypothetical protein PLANPX_0985 [Lacipirellula parvula]